MIGFIPYMQLLEEYLFQYQRLPLPSIGALRIQKKPATLQMLDKSIDAGGYTFEFRDKELPATHLLQWLAAKTGDTIEQQEKKLSGFVTSLKESLSQTGNWEWAGIGAFQSDAMALLSFKGNDLPITGYEQVAAEKIIRKELSADVLVGDKVFTGDEMKVLLKKPKKLLAVFNLKWAIVCIMIILAGLIALFIYQPALIQEHQWHPAFEKKNPPANHSKMITNE